jgi:hypothetical protein
MGLLALALLLAAGVAQAGGPLAPAGRYAGKVKATANTSALSVSFTIKRGKLSNLQVGPGTAFCHWWSGLGDPFENQMPRLSGFPAVRLSPPSKFGPWAVEVTFKRSSPNAPWTVSRDVYLSQGPFYVELQLDLVHGKWISYANMHEGLAVMFGATPGTTGWDPGGTEECFTGGPLTAAAKR